MLELLQRVMFLLGWALVLGLVETTSPLSVAQQQQPQQHQQQHHQHQPLQGQQQQQQGHFPSKIGSPDGLIIEDSPIAPSSQYIVQKDVWTNLGGAGSSNHHNHLHNQSPSSPSGSSSSGSSSSDVPHRSRLVPDSNDTFHSFVPGVVGGNGAAGGMGGAGAGGGGSSGFRGFFDGSEWTLKECFSLRRSHHLYYQIGNGLFFLAFLAPNAPFGMLWLRCLVIAGCVMMIVWGWQVECTLDAVIWASLFLVFNAIYVGALLCKLRPVRFEKEIEAVSC